MTYVLFFLAAAVSLGLIFLGRSIALKSHHAGSESLNERKAEGSGAALGMVGLGVALLCAAIIGFWWTTPTSPSTQTKTAAPAKGTTAPVKVAKPTSPTKMHRVFKAPSKNVYCSTFRTSGRVGCVITIHFWEKKKKNCKFLYTLGPTGPSVETSCPKEKNLVKQMWGLPPTAKDQLTREEYGTPMDMGNGITCTVVSQGTRCDNGDGYGFMISRQSREQYPF